VPVFNSQCLKLAGALADLLPTLAQLLPGKRRDGRRQPLGLTEIERSQPAAGFHETGKIDEEGLDAGAPKHRTQLLAPFPRLLQEHAGQRLEAWLGGVELSLPSHHVVGHDVKIPEVSHLLAEPARLGAEAAHFRAFQHWTEDGKDAAQAAQPDPQLVRPLRNVELLDHGYVGGDLVKALAQHIAGGLLGCLVGVEHDVLGIAGR
jgi:hypothetical protein